MAVLTCVPTGTTIVGAIADAVKERAAATNGYLLIGGGVYRVTPVDVADGQAADFLTDAAGRLVVTVGTAAAGLGKAEDAAHASADVGVFILGVRSDTPTQRAGTDVDYSAINTDDLGLVWVTKGRNVGGSINIKASGAESADTTGADVTDARFEVASALMLVLDVTAQSGTTPTLDVVVQVKVGSLYFNLCRFAQRAATTTKTALIVKRDQTVGSEITLESDPAVGTNVLINNFDWLDVLRYKSDIGGTGSPSYTYSVVAYPIR